MIATCWHFGPLFFATCWGVPVVPFTDMVLPPHSALSLLQLGAQEVEEAESPLQSGDRVFLQTVNGKVFDVDWVRNGQVLARLNETKGKQPLTIEKIGAGPIWSGETIVLGTHLNKYVDNKDGKLKARSTEITDYHKLIISKVKGGPIHPGDTVFLMSMSGALIDARGEEVQASRNDYSDANRFIFRRHRYGALHDVVGPDGVLMITLQREGEAPRNGYSLDQLSAASIFPVEFSATDAKAAPYWELQLTCPLEAESGSDQWCGDMGRMGQTGCKSTIEQAITDSHRRALVAAMGRKDSHDWTAIIEDDVVPLRPERFDEEFRKAWEGLPSEAKIVRLGWCTFESDLGPIVDRPFNNHGVSEGRDFKLVRERWWTDADGKEHYYTGGCTTGYMVHRSFIPELLKIFPCCCPIDCCMERQLFYAQAVNGTDDEYGKWRGAQIMVDMDAWSSRKYSTGFATFNQSGVLLQDNRNIKSERPEWNAAA